MNNLENGTKQGYEKVPLEETTTTTTKTQTTNKKTLVPLSYGLGVRHVQSLLVFSCLVVLSMVKAHLGVTIVAMTSNTNSNGYNETTELHKSIQNLVINKTEEIFPETTLNSSLYNSLSKKDSTEASRDIEQNATDDDVAYVWNAHQIYNWPKSTQEIVLNSFIFGYVLMAFPMGIICQRWGGKLPLQIALIVNGFSSLPIPWLTMWGGWKAVSCCRVLQGATQAGMMPSVHTLLTKWVPPSERGRFVCYVYTGVSFGAVVAFQLGGVLAAECGWPATFWLTGSLCLVVFVVFSMFGAPSPDVHKYISVQERNFIVGHTDTGIVKKRKTPWRAMMTSRHVLGVFVGHVGGLVSNVFCYIQVPSYVHHVLGVNIKNSGILSSLPFIFTCIGSSGFGMLSDFWTNRRILSVKTARKFFNSVSEFGFSLCIIVVSFTTNVPLAISLFVVSLTLHSAMHVGGVLSYIDMAPNYSGVLMATGNTLANLVLLCLPPIVSHIVIDLKSQFEWRIMFCIVSGLSILGNVSYLLFMSADVQPWNDYEYEVADEEESKKKLQEDLKTLEDTKKNQES